MNKRRKWRAMQTSRYSGVMILGDRNELQDLPADMLISITHGRNMNLFQIVLSSIVNHLIIVPGLARNEDLLYAELGGDLTSGESLTLTVWRSKGMVRFRDSGGHGWASKWLTGIVFGQNVTAWFLTYTARNHRIPTTDEARRLSESFGKMLKSGSVVRSSMRPIFSED